LQDGTLLAALAALALAGPAAAQNYPARVIKLVVPYTPGSPNDVMARLLTQHLAPRLGQPIVIDNKPGGGTTIGTKAAATAEPDGYTLLLSAHRSHSTAP
jgi:tripartite-type tricarboxylate transporter receptor subunit TctC